MAQRARVHTLGENKGAHTRGEADGRGARGAGVWRWQQRAVVPFLPLRDPQLNADTYTSLLLHFMEHDPPELLRLISEWPSSVYDTTGLIKAAQVPVIRCCCGGI